MEPHIEAKVEFLRAADGGKTQPVRSGYRPQFHYDGEDWDALPTFETDDWVHPGETVKVSFRFTLPEVHRSRLHVGKRFELREGAQVVAQGEVTRLLGWD
jgi:elongation factor Tu